MAVDRTDWPMGRSEGWTELGSEHLASPLRNGDEQVGWVVAHRRPADGEWCFGYVYRADTAEPAKVTWDVVAEEPLTLSPSILCRTCGDHGYIRGGRWVAA